MAFTLPDLPYALNALEPHIDQETMGIHHGKHHQTYITKLNEAIAGTSLEGKTLEALCAEESNRPAIRNNGGGHFNHSLFWKSLSPKGGGRPEGALARAIEESFGAFDQFKEKFIQTALTRFGSGWAWLCQKEKVLCICSTANQDNPLMSDCCESTSRPLLGVDVWEHAYYLRYQNRRPEYLAALFEVINWDAVAERYASDS